MTTDVELVFWPGSVRMHPFADHARAAAAGGFTSMTISPDTFQNALASGLTARDVKQIAVDAGVPIRQLDTITDWNPVRCSDILQGPLRARFDVTADECFSICETLELEHVLAFPGFLPGEVEKSAMIDGFGKLCERAAASNIWVSLEFVPVLGVPNLSTAWDIIKGADQSNCGFLFDTWHFSKGDADFDLLRSLPPERLTCVQLADGRKALRGKDLAEDGFFFREFPGEGDLPLAEILAIFLEKGGLRWIGPETFSHTADALEATEAGRRDGDGVRRLLANSRISQQIP